MSDNPEIKAGPSQVPLLRNMLDPKAEITLCWKPNYEPFLSIRSHLSIKKRNWSVTHDYAKQPTAQLNPPDKLKNPALMTK